MNSSTARSDTKTRLPHSRHTPGYAAFGSLALIVLLCAGSGAVANEEGGAADTLSKEELMATGEKIYNQTCASCHQANGMGIPGVYPPLVDGAPFQGAEFLTKPLEERGFWENGRIKLAPVETHIKAVLDGIPNSRMFSFDLVLTDVEIAAVVTYERNAWGNNSGDVVQPAQVDAAR